MNEAMGVFYRHFAPLERKIFEAKWLHKNLRDLLDMLIQQERFGPRPKSKFILESCLIVQP